MPSQKLAIAADVFFSTDSGLVDSSANSHNDSHKNSYIIKIAERSNIKHVVAMDSKVNPSTTKVNVITKKDF